MSTIFESRYNLKERLDTPAAEFEYVVLNSFSGSIDALSRDAMEVFNSASSGKDGHPASAEEYLDYFVRRGYFYPRRDDEAEKVDAVKQAGDSLGRPAAPRLVILTTYDCNLNCTYCYQRSMKREKLAITPGRIARVFDYVDGLPDSARRGLTIDVIGGEPLLDKEPNRQGILAIVAGCEKRGVRFRVISNGVNLAMFVDVLAGAGTLDFVQVTLDGPPAVQAKRRPRRREDYIGELEKGISLALDRGVRIAARTNIDTGNVADLEGLTAWYAARGWLGRKGFYPYVSPVHDHDCGSCNSAFDEYRILDRLLAYEDSHPDVVAWFNRSNFLSYQYLKNPLANGTFSSPRYYRCEANTNQLVFDPEGLLYACIEAAGSREHTIGTYDPDFRLDDAQLRAWRDDRDITNMAACRACEICFICGGNCAWSALKAGGGSDHGQCGALRESVRLLLRKRGHLLVARGEPSGA